VVLAGELCATATCGTSALLLCTRQNEGEWCVQDCGLNLYLFMLAVSAAPRLLLVGCPDMQAWEGWLQAATAAACDEPATLVLEQVASCMYGLGWDV
jgi:hypothetical protein